MSQSLAQAREEISGHMDRILSVFKPGARITVIVRTPDNNEGDLLLTNDSLTEAVAVIERSKTRPEQ